jgi:dihydrofolate reductase
LKKNNQQNLIVIGHAIISCDCCIADSNGNMPDGLLSVKDWEFFQKDLDESDLVILGRKSYENFHQKKRNRLIPTSKIRDYYFENSDLCFFNPSDISVEKIINLYNSYPKKIAVAGGQGVYKLVFDQFFYTQFCLSIKMNQFMRGGQSFVNGLNTIENIKKYMEEKGMQIQEERKLDSETIQYIYSQS